MRTDSNSPGEEAPQVTIADSPLPGICIALHKMNRMPAEMSYHFYNSRFGRVLIASTPVGICHIAFVDDDVSELRRLREKIPDVQMIKAIEPIHQQIMLLFEETEHRCVIPLHVSGTDFQMRVWRCLLNIQAGDLATYREIAIKLGKPSAARAVGTAVGSNPVAFLIPCHRVIHASGKIGHYMWGSDRKKKLILWEKQTFSRPPSAPTLF